MFSGYVRNIACARLLLADRQAFYPQFASHNAHTVAAVTELAGDRERLLAMAEQARRQARPDATADVGGVCMEAACA